ncbi:unnamed protein product [Cyprideis torosa]|uniref:Uncharacterized protein n=1 Tax=Cyprideis torosa TaxID=163714 RepID=A0A7R8ZP16_9CRUS|nr:unnamed protein product [Cyprideis torosa]CAG0892866.1 unnamed protein product [Cyprideis torosa]
MTSMQWADEVEEGEQALPPRSEKIENGQKIVTEYKYNDEGKQTKVVRTYKLEKKRVKKAIAKRRNLPKFGKIGGDIGDASTIVAEEVFMQFILGEEADDQDDDDPLSKLKAKQGAIVKCRFCKEDHWTSQCPYKDHLVQLKPANGTEEKKEVEDPKTQAAAASKGKESGEKAIKYLNKFGYDHLILNCEWAK